MRGFSSGEGANARLQNCCVGRPTPTKSHLVRADGARVHLCSIGPLTRKLEPEPAKQDVSVSRRTG